MNLTKMFLIIASLLCHSAFADEICKAQTSLGTIVGHGATLTAAQADAANRCFDKHVAVFEAKRGAVSEDRGMDIIDHCANIECSK